jgi:catechol 2,3-dioxygenase-like lactoylglutathione lyase family enzyme
MKFNHLSFPSKDIAATTAFFVNQLGCTAERFPGFSVLKRAGFDIVIEDASERSVVWPENFHLGFELSSVEEVRELYDRFLSQGVVMQTGVIQHPRGSRFFCEAPGGLLFEMNTRADAEERFRASFERQAHADGVK